MRRTTDRFEAMVRVVLLTVFLTAGPPIAVGVVHCVGATGSHAERSGTTRYPVTAILQRDAAPPAGRLGMAVTRPLVQARWTTTDGVPRTGDIHASWHRTAGSTATIWVDRAGRPVDPPPQRSQLIAQAIFFAALALSGTLLAVLAIHLVVRQILDRWRLSEWQAEWCAVEPQWSGRRRNR